MSTRLTSKGLAIGLFIAATILTLTSLGIWISTGSHSGWSKNRIEIPKVDPITEIEYVEYEERFIMGVEYLGLGLTSALVLAGVGIFILRRPQKP